jgi:hypothetical protein
MSVEGLSPLVNDPYLRVTNLDLSKEETAALLKELNGIIEADRFPLSSRIRVLKALFGQRSDRIQSANRCRRQSIMSRCGRSRPRGGAPGVSSVR